MRVIALEEKRVFTLRRNLIDLTVISGGDVKIPGLIENQVPDIFCAGRKILGRSPRWIQGWLGRIFWRRRVFRGIFLGGLAALAGVSFFPDPVLDLVDLAVGRRGGVDHTM